MGRERRWRYGKKGEGKGACHRKVPQESDIASWIRSYSDNDQWQERRMKNWRQFLNSLWKIYTDLIFIYSLTVLCTHKQVTIHTNCAGNHVITYTYYQASGFIYAFS